MAGSYSHLKDQNTGKFCFDLIENLGDAHEACEECFWLINHLAKNDEQKIAAALNAYYKSQRPFIEQEEIDSFTGDYRFLSNFYPAMVKFEGEFYHTVEHAYQAAKTLNLDDRWAIRKLETPGKAKRKGRNVVLRKDWDDIKDDIMLNLLRDKFTIPALRNQLLDTGFDLLVEGNTWGDTYWGICNGSGKNMLGKLLMKVRDESLTE